jgi:L-amino acid N-acyltransferase YncA
MRGQGLRPNGMETRRSHPDPAGVVTRRAVPADAPALAEIYNDAIEERIATFETAPRSESAMRDWIGQHDDFHPVLVTEVSDPGGDAKGGHQVVAWASIASYRPRECYVGVGEFSIYVQAGYRGRGIGQHLLGSLVDEARELGYWKLVSRMFPHNTASRRLVARCGFREVGVYEKHGKLDGRWLDTVIVERLIPENLR